jgi:hypothetical protein
MEECHFDDCVRNEESLRWRDDFVHGNHLVETSFGLEWTVHVTENRTTKKQEQGLVISLELSDWVAWARRFQCIHAFVDNFVHVVGELNVLSGDFEQVPEEHQLYGEKEM